MNQPKVIALVGMPGAGKSYCVEHLEAAGLPSVYFGGITLEEVKARGLDINPQNEKVVREDIRAKEGKDAYAKRIIKKIEQLVADGHSTVVADGLYSWTEYRAFKERFGDNSIIIAIAAPRVLRHQRLSNRPIRPLTEQEVIAREYAEIENLEKGGPIANADFTLINDGRPEQVLSALDQILKTI
ncbi:MAG: AAA family ATPase [Candidatus Saccharimonadales bacterium]